MIDSSIAQLVERKAVNFDVPRSSRGGGAFYDKFMYSNDLEKVMNRRDVLKSMAAIVVTPSMLMASPAKPKLRVVSHYIKRELVDLWNSDHRKWVDRLYMTLSNGNRMMSWVDMTIICEAETGLYTCRDYTDRCSLIDWKTGRVAAERDTYTCRDFDAAEIFASRYFGVEDNHAGILEYADLY